MSARERVLAALEGSPEVRPGTAEQLVADLVAESLRAGADEISALPQDYECDPGRGDAADLLHRRADAAVRKAEYGCETPESHNYGCPCEKDTATRGESTRSRLSSLKLAAFFAGSFNGRAMTGGTQ